MNNKNFNFIFILILFGFASILSWNLYFKDYKQQDTVNIHQFPKSFEGWTSTELTISEDEYAILETRNAFVRRYKAKKDKEIYLYIVYSQHNRKVSHPPEVCYVGSGITVVDNVHDQIDLDGDKKTINVNRLLLEQTNTQQLAMYWFKVGNEFTSNYWKQQALIALHNLQGHSVSSAMIRVSATVREGNVEEANKTVKDFSKSIVPYLFEYLP